MSVIDNFRLVKEIINISKDECISTEDLLNIFDKSDKSIGLSDLVQYWKEGTLFASAVVREQHGYYPKYNCVWTTKFKQGFFGYNDNLGSFEINLNSPIPMNIILEASIGLGAKGLCLAIHPELNEFAIGTSAGTIIICNLTKGKAIRSFERSNSPAYSLAYSPTDNLLVSGHEDGSLIKWNSDGEILHRINTESWVRSIDFSNNGQHILTSHYVPVGSISKIILWNSDSLEQISEYTHVTETVWVVQFLPDMDGFATCGTDRKVTVWSDEKNDIIWVTNKLRSTVTALAIHPIGGVIASGAWSGTVKLWNSQTGDNIRSIEAHFDRVYGLDFSPSGKILASGGKDSSICLWKQPDCSIINKWIAHNGWVRSLRFIDEDTIISIGSDGICKIWRLSPDRPLVDSIQEYSNSTEVINDYLSYGADDE